MDMAMVMAQVFAIVMAIFTSMVTVSVMVVVCGDGDGVTPAPRSTGEELALPLCGYLLQAALFHGIPKELGSGPPVQRLALAACVRRSALLLRVFFLSAFWPEGMLVIVLFVDVLRSVRRYLTQAHARWVRGRPQNLRFK